MKRIVIVRRDKLQNDAKGDKESVGQNGALLPRGIVIRGVNKRSHFPFNEAESHRRSQ
jgi:hypothetical protein